MPTAPSSASDTYVHPDDERMAAFRRVYEQHLVVDDVYPDLARRIVAGNCMRFVDLGGGRGELCTLVAQANASAVLVDGDAHMVAEGSRPAIRADLHAFDVPGWREKASAIDPPLDHQEGRAHLGRR